MPAPLELQITSQGLVSLAGASQQLRDYLSQQGAGERALYAADLALEELGTNILSYGFPADETATFQLRATVTSGLVELVFEDKGIAFDPSASPEPKPSTSLEETAIGGLGIHMVRQAVSRLLYSRTENGNRLEVQIVSESPH